MLLYLFSRIISAGGAFLYPTYASYKTLSRRPASETDLERWLMYWSVLGTLLAVEYTAEWLVSWIPFYYPLKTLFFLYLALPQTRGASYIYTTQLHPRLAAHEPEIDAALQRARDAGFKWVQGRLQALWNHLASNDSGPTTTTPTTDARQSTPVDLAGTSPINIAYGLWRRYTASALGAVAILQGPQPQSTPPPPPSPVAHHTSLLARRRALEAELASLPLPPPSPSPSATPPLERVASSTYLPAAQGDDRGRYEEIARDEADTTDDDAAGERRSWWPGWARSDGYEKVKSE